MSLLAVYRGDELPPPLPTVWDDDPVDQVSNGRFPICFSLTSLKLPDNLYYVN